MPIQIEDEAIESRLVALVLVDKVTDIHFQSSPSLTRSIRGNGAIGCKRTCLNIFASMLRNEGSAPRVIGFFDSNFSFSQMKAATALSPVTFGAGPSLKFLGNGSSL